MLHTGQSFKAANPDLNCEIEWVHVVLAYAEDSSSRVIAEALSLYEKLPSLRQDKRP